ncbi:hypothetical protein [Aurantiacibacter flavus]|uniref:4a-hydroxytetrahydrobiopterin dehydratase n=1 Tax=Aurantiacibacter flavus TaxID=3145232 RepID=A0ABV0CV66_9SPHN
MIRWPDHIPAGERRGAMFDFADVDGVSQLAVAQGQAEAAWHR